MFYNCDGDRQYLYHHHCHGVLVVQPDLCRSSGETPMGAPAMAVIVIIVNHERRHQNHDRHQKHDIHQKHHLHQKYDQNPTIIITDKSPPWWDSVMVGISWVTIIKSIIIIKTMIVIIFAI